MLVDESRRTEVTVFGMLQSNLNSLDFSLLLHDVTAIADEVEWAVDAVNGRLHGAREGQCSDLHRIFRIPVEGGVSVEIAQILGENIGGRLSISPDGKFLAYPYRESMPVPATKLAIIHAEGGSPTKVLNAPGVVWGLVWSPDGTSLQYSFPHNGAYNILGQPLTGGEPRHLTKFSSGIIFDFHWSLDGKRLLMARGEASSDAALLSNLR